jgi:hypothetical protein
MKPHLATAAIIVAAVPSVPMFVPTSPAVGGGRPDSAWSMTARPTARGGIVRSGPQLRLSA